MNLRRLWSIVALATAWATEHVAESCAPKLEGSPTQVALDVVDRCGPMSLDGDDDIAEVSFLQHSLVKNALVNKISAARDHANTSVRSVTNFSAARDHATTSIRSIVVVLACCTFTLYVSLVRETNDELCLANAKASGDAPRDEKAFKDSRTLTDDDGGKLASLMGFPAVDAARLLGAVHIIYHHFSPKSLPGGPLWLTYFFIIAGLGSATSRLSREVESNPFRVSSPSALMPSMRIIFKRVATVYPTYLLALLPCLWIHKSIMNQNIEKWSLGLELLMLSSFIDKLPEGYAPVYNSPDWFMTALLFCWIFENSAFELMARIYRVCTWLTLPLASVMAYAVIGSLWLDGHVFFGQWWQGLPAYFVGVALAFAIKWKAVSPMLINWASTMAVLLMFVLLSHLMFINRADYTESQVCAVYWPLLLLFIIGLCGDSDFVSVVLSLKPLPAIGRHISMGMYLLQKPAFSLFCHSHSSQCSGSPLEESIDPEKGCLAYFVIILAVIAAVAQSFVQDPLQRIMLRIIT